MAGEDWGWEDTSLDETPPYQSPGDDLGFGINDFDSPVLLTPAGVMAPVDDWNFSVGSGTVSPPFKVAPIGELNYTFPGVDFGPYFAQGAFDVAGEDFNPRMRPAQMPEFPMRANPEGLNADFMGDFNPRGQGLNLDFLGDFGNVLGDAARGAGDFLAGFGATPAYADEGGLDSDSLLAETGIGGPGTGETGMNVEENLGLFTGGTIGGEAAARQAQGPLSTTPGDQTFQNVIKANGAVSGSTLLPPAASSELSQLLGQDVREQLRRYFFENGKYLDVGSETSQVYSGSALSTLGAKPSMGTADAAQQAWNSFMQTQPPATVDPQLWSAAAGVARNVAAQQGVAAGVKAGRDYITSVLNMAKTSGNAAQSIQNANTAAAARVASSEIAAAQRTAAAELKAQTDVARMESDFKEALLKIQQQDEKTKLEHERGVADLAEKKRQFDISMEKAKQQIAAQAQMAREANMSREAIAKFQAEASAMLKEKELAMQRYIQEQKSALADRERADRMKLEQTKLALQRRQMMMAGRGGTTRGGGQMVSRRGPAAPRSPYGTPEQWAY